MTTPRVTVLSPSLSLLRTFRNRLRHSHPSQACPLVRPGRPTECAALKTGTMLKSECLLQAIALAGFGFARAKLIAESIGGLS
jgi:hypothetical protein